MSKMFEHKRKVFRNGLRLVTAPLHNTRAVTVFIMVKVGSRCEEKRQNGLSHFLEHVFFKGTKKRPTTLDIAKELDAVGAQYNAFTSEEWTGFYVEADSDHFQLGGDILFDMLKDPLLDVREIEREKGVITEEINMYQDTPMSYVQELAKKVFYGDHPLGRQVVGLKETVLKFTRDDFVRYKQQFYTPENMVIAIAGGETSKKWETFIQETFGEFPAKRPSRWKAMKERQRKPAALTHYKKTDQAHLIVGVRSFPRDDKRRPVLKVMNTLLGGTMSSRLFIEVRERRGLAYYVSSSMVDFSDAGALVVGAGVDTKKIGHALEVILQNLRKLKEKPISQGELRRAQDNIKGRTYLGLEDSMSVAQFISEQEMFWEKIKTPEQVIAEVYEVTPKDIQSVAQDIFRNDRLNLAVVGPYKDGKQLEKYLKI